MKLGRKLIFFGVLMGIVRCSFAQSSDILWARFGWPLGVDGVSNWLCISTDRQQIFTSTFGGSERWPLTYSDHPSRVRTVDLIGDATWPGGQCAPLMPKGDSALIFFNGHAFGEWYFNSGRVAIIAHDSIAVTSLDVSPDGSLIAATGSSYNQRDDSLHIIDRGTGIELWSIPNAVNIVRFSPDGRLLLTGMKNGAGLALVDVIAHSIIHNYNQFSSTDNVTWDPAVESVFAIDGGNISDIFHHTFILDTSGQIAISGYFGGSSAFNDFDFSPDGKYIVGSGGVIRVADGQPVHLDDPFHELDGAYDIGFLNNDTIIVVGRDVSLFSVSQQSYIRSINGGALSLSFSGDGTKLAGVGVVDAATGLSIYNGGYGEHTVTSHNGLVTVGVNNDNGLIYLGQFDPAASTTGFVNDIILQDALNDTSGFFQPSLAFSPADTVFASGMGVYSYDNNIPLQDSLNVVKLWSVKWRSEIREFRDPKYRAVMGIAFSSDGSMLAGSFAGGGSEWFYVWNVNDGSILYKKQSMGGYQLFFLPGDTSILFDGQYIYNFKSQTSFEIPNNPVWNFSTIAMMPGMKEFAGIQTTSGQPCSGIQIIDIATGNIVHTIQTPDSEIINCLAVNPVTGDIAIGGQDLIVYKSFGNDAVAQSHTRSSQPLQAFTSNSRITVDVPSGEERGKVFVYGSDGRCYFTAEVASGEQSVTTSALPMGDYFIVFEPASGAPAFTKVSLF